MEFFLSEARVTESLRMKIYRTLSKLVFGQPSEERTQQMKSLSLNSIDYWFHAASAGELETLIPLIERMRASDKKLLVTSFSKSALPQLNKIQGDTVVVSLSPLEGNWLEWLARLKPRAFITVKYEAWPELWASLSQCEIPLLILGAQARSSLRWVLRLSSILGFSIPKNLKMVSFFQKESREARLLLTDFPQSEVVYEADPRWDRVFDRLEKGSQSRSDLWFEAARDFPRPWRGLAQVWPSDFNHLRSLIEPGFEGTTWIIPHRLDSKNLDDIVGCLGSVGATEIHQLNSEGRLERKGSASQRSAPIILVAETGLLVELYAGMDQVYIGGGFESGVHSTLEPAVRGIPLACGPMKVEYFSEIQALIALGQLGIVRNDGDLQGWFERAKSSPPKDRENWLLAARKRRGASERLFARIESWYPVHQ
jgi:3-deoxy-D-manno-octulosonic-acid transferase